MTDLQILTIAIAIVFPCLSVVLALAAWMYSNKRLDDTNKRMDDMKAELIRHMDNGFAHMELLLELHEAKHHGNP